jgi:sugar phosphate isomerase/epimerase
MAKPGVALQMYSVRGEMQQDFVGTLRAVKGLGYRAVELVSYFGTFGLSSAELRRVFSDLGLTPMGIHVSPESLENAFGETVGYYLGAGVPEIILPSLPRGSYDSADGCKRGGAWLADLGRRCKALGAGLSYHNHHSDFHVFGDKYGLDLILGDSDRESVGLEADVYWITYAGLDPAAIIRKYADRVRLVHLKDRPAVVDVTIEDAMAGRGDLGKLFAEVGEGIVDWPAVFAASEETPAAWYVVEQDAGTRPMLEAVAISLRHLKEWGKT